MQRWWRKVGDARMRNGTHNCTTGWPLLSQARDSWPWRRPLSWPSAGCDYCKAELFTATWLEMYAERQQTGRLTRCPKTPSLPQNSVTSPKLRHLPITPSLPPNSVTSPKLRYLPKTPSLPQNSVTSPKLRYLPKTPSLPQNSVTSPRLRHCPKTPSPPQNSVTSPRLRHCPKTPSPPQNSVTSPRLRHCPKTPSPPLDSVTAPKLRHLPETPSPPPKLRHIPKTPSPPQDSVTAPKLRLTAMTPWLSKARGEWVVFITWHTARASRVQFWQQAHTVTQCTGSVSHAFFFLSFFIMNLSDCTGIMKTIPTADPQRETWGQGVNRSGQAAQAPRGNAQEAHLSRSGLAVTLHGRHGADAQQAHSRSSQAVRLHGHHGGICGQQAHLSRSGQLSGCKGVTGPISAPDTQRDSWGQGFSRSGPAVTLHGRHGGNADSTEAHILG